ncbi:MAG: GNAT family N-acetyltransferase [Thermoproteota archaeon]|nr:GNAT family N-acetyltransferase [Thermoproteota archaeon]
MAKVILLIPSLFNLKMSLQRLSSKRVDIQLSTLENALHFISDIVVNEFKITLDFDNLDSDLLHIKQYYDKDNGGCFWVVEQIDNYQIIGTVAIRKLIQFTSTAELKRMFLSKPYRGLGIRQIMLDTAINFAKKLDYSEIFLYSSKDLTVSRILYIKNGFIDILRYNDDHRADVFMKKTIRYQ